MDFTGKTGPQLVEMYNEMLATWMDLGGDNTFGTVKRFSTAEVGRTRCAKLHAAITEKRGSEETRDLRPPFLAAKELPPGDVEAVNEAAREGTPVTPEAAPAGSSSGVSDISWSEMTGADLKSEDDDMAKKRKAGRKPARKASAARRTEGPTLKDYTAEYNALVPAAKKAGVTFAKVHTSLFESKDKAVAQLDRLKKAIKAGK